MQDQIWPTIVTLAGILGAAVLIAWIIRPRETAAVLNAAPGIHRAIAAARPGRSRRADDPGWRHGPGRAP